MNPNQQVAAQAGVWIVAVFVSLIVGAVIGLIPLTMGRNRNDETVGLVGFLACMAGGFLSGILGAGSMAIGFAIAILIGRRG